MRVAFSTLTLDGLADEMSGASTFSKIHLNDACTQIMICT